MTKRREPRWSGRVLAQLVSLVVLGGLLGATAVGEVADNPLKAHLAPMLTTDDEWRTPNPDYEPGENRPKEFAIQLRLQPDGKHALGELMGVYEDGRRVTYWSMIAMYNPVTEKIVTQQVGWDGTLAYGENDVRSGDTEIIDMIQYSVDGTMSINRHEATHVGEDVRKSDVFVRDANGDWSLEAQWTWRRVPGAKPGSAAGEYSAGALGDIVGYLVTGSGHWRAPNPEYVPGTDEARSFGMNFRWGQRKRFLVGEIVSIAEDGRSSKDWSLYVTYNPVTGRAHLYQTGANGVYFRGELGTTQSGMHSQTGLVYLPDGNVKSVRDEVEIPNEDTRVSHVFERDDAGGWQKVRQWTWVQVPASDSSR